MLKSRSDTRPVRGNDVCVPLIVKSTLVPRCVRTDESDMDVYSFGPCCCFSSCSSGDLRHRRRVVANSSLNGRECSSVFPSPSLDSRRICKGRWSRHPSKYHHGIGVDENTHVCMNEPRRTLSHRCRFMQSIGSECDLTS
jgi:hypothetical protein